MSTGIAKDESEDGIGKLRGCPEISESYVSDVDVQKTTGGSESSAAGCVTFLEGSSAVVGIPIQALSTGRSSPVRRVQ